jgi:2,4-dienoyl-CoA reductase-like NADH-dependent reductase (Old Yellow Enzyme family)
MPSNDLVPIAPSAIKIRGDVHTSKGKVPHIEPKELTIEEIMEVIN